jgi:hypothetical protein
VVVVVTAVDVDAGDVVVVLLGRVVVVVVALGTVVEVLVAPRLLAQPAATSAKVDTRSARAHRLLAVTSPA